MKKLFYVTDKDINSRIDRWFKRNVSDVPQSLIEKNLRKGHIKVNNKKKKSSYKLQKTDQIFIDILILQSKSHKKIRKQYTPTNKELSSLPGIFIESNENFVVINKPANISVQPGTKSIRNILDILKNTREFIKSTPFIVHRIDKETTGILIVAKNRKYAQLFTTLFRIRKIHKTYYAIVLGEFSKAKGTFEDDLIYYEGEKKTYVKAITHFTVIDSNRNYSFLMLNPVTGRKHQLRKQLFILGHSILGDKKYNSQMDNKSINKNLMLHSYEIKFMINNNKYTYRSSLPDYFKNMLKIRRLNFEY